MSRFLGGSNTGSGAADLTSLQDGRFNLNVASLKIQDSLVNLPLQIDGSNQVFAGAIQPSDVAYDFAAQESKVSAVELKTQNMTSTSGQSSFSGTIATNQIKDLTGVSAVNLGPSQIDLVALNVSANGKKLATLEDVGGSGGSVIMYLNYSDSYPQAALTSFPGTIVGATNQSSPAPSNPTQIRSLSGTAIPGPTKYNVTSLISVQNTESVISQFAIDPSTVSASNFMPEGVFELNLFAHCDLAQSLGHIGLRYRLYGHKIGQPWNAQQLVELGVSSIEQVTQVSPAYQQITLTSQTEYTDMSLYDALYMIVLAINSDNQAREVSAYYQSAETYSHLHTPFPQVNISVVEWQQQQARTQNISGSPGSTQLAGQLAVTGGVSVPQISSTADLDIVTTGLLRWNGNQLATFADIPPDVGTVSTRTQNILATTSPAGTNIQGGITVTNNLVQTSAFTDPTQWGVQQVGSSGSYGFMFTLTKTVRVRSLAQLKSHNTSPFQPSRSVRLYNADTQAIIVNLTLTNQTTPTDQYYYLVPYTEILQPGNYVLCTDLYGLEDNYSIALMSSDQRYFSNIQGRYGPLNSFPTLFGGLDQPTCMNIFVTEEISYADLSVERKLVTPVIESAGNIDLNPVGGAVNINGSQVAKLSDLGLLNDKAQNIDEALTTPGTTTLTGTIVATTQVDSTSIRTDTIGRLASVGSIQFLNTIGLAGNNIAGVNRLFCDDIEVIGGIVANTGGFPTVRCNTIAARSPGTVVTFNHPINLQNLHNILGANAIGCNSISTFSSTATTGNVGILQAISPATSINVGSNLDLQSLYNIHAALGVQTVNIDPVAGQSKVNCNTNLDMAANNITNATTVSATNISGVNLTCQTMNERTPYNGYVSKSTPQSITGITGNINVLTNMQGNLTISPAEFAVGATWLLKIAGTVSRNGTTTSTIRFAGFMSGFVNDPLFDTGGLDVTVATATGSRYFGVEVLITCQSLGTAGQFISSCNFTASPTATSATGEGAVSQASINTTENKIFELLYTSTGVINVCTINHIVLTRIY